jgi:hypothetical protein
LGKAISRREECIRVLAQDESLKSAGACMRPSARKFLFSSQAIDERGPIFAAADMDKAFG